MIERVVIRTSLVRTRLMRTSLAAGLLLLAAGAASASPAVVVSNLNLRQGPGTNYGIITTIPGGSAVDVVNCAGEWCNVTFGDRGGYVLARNLDMGTAGGAGVGPGPVVVQGPVVVGPPVYYGYYGRYWGPRYYGGWGWRRHW